MHGQGVGERLKHLYLWVLRSPHVGKFLLYHLQALWP